MFKYFHQHFYIPTQISFWYKWCFAFKQANELFLNAQFNVLFVQKIYFKSSKKILKFIQKYWYMIFSELLIVCHYHELFWHGDSNFLFFQMIVSKSNK